VGPAAIPLRSGVHIVPAGSAPAAEIQNVEMRPLDDPTFQAIYDAWLGHLVLLCRGQQLTDQDLIAFGRRFDNLDWAPGQEAIVWRRPWRPGDVILWDNRATMHCRDSFDGSLQRILRRTQIKGETPPTA
jgi:alpha-ketoglutarate-dependent taurine dioxygenase